MRGGRPVAVLHLLDDAVLRKLLGRLFRHRPSKVTPIGKGVAEGRHRGDPDNIARGHAMKRGLVLRPRLIYVEAARGCARRATRHGVSRNCCGPLRRRGRWNPSRTRSSIGWGRNKNRREGDLRQTAVSVCARV